MKIVAVTFTDATTYDFWATGEEVAKTECKVCLGVGMLVKKDEKVVKIAMLNSKQKQGYAEAFSNWVDIPAAAVLSFRVVEEEQDS